ncbi:MAG: BREX-1 system adenine-specific DNA-methyltransferase PglX [Clostridia bacterium]|nr:BREX-1 system adenine-specific DNA-methyltransferase PglX [Clostridia bacterium]
MSRLISDKYLAVQQEYLERFERLRANEVELNRIFIDIYSLQGELSPEVAEKDVTVYRIIDQPNDEQRRMAYVLSMHDEIVSLISYIVGCMLGRYSPYVDGLLFAGGEWDYDAICARIAEGARSCDFYDDSLGLFLPDRDAIVPVTDDEYFADDVVARTVEFVKKVYGADTLEENLKFLADALGNKGDSPRDVLRNYYLNDFYRDHLKTYQKRPIYWQFDSGKQNGFKALVYLHRYDRDTVARVRTDYVHEIQERLRTQLEDARKTAETGEGRMRMNAAKRAQKLEKQLAEVNKYEEIVHHYADMRLPLDLDDGVKVNYSKLGGLLTKVK